MDYLSYPNKQFTNILKPLVIRNLKVHAVYSLWLEGTFQMPELPIIQQK